MAWPTDSPTNELVRADRLRQFAIEYFSFTPSISSGDLSYCRNDYITTKGEGHFWGINAFEGSTQTANQYPTEIEFMSQF
ncbi:MAG: hypothetical protein EOP47_04640 [Sphingobacteriaceae bacterium]|nr:MAG: hypothetical protein EOP47_04640 [Sphingobacteriaceae bacterium]